MLCTVFPHGTEVRVGNSVFTHVHSHVFPCVGRPWSEDEGDYSITMVGKDGKQYENRIVNVINDATSNEVRAIPSGYSGSQKGPAEDFIVTTLHGNYSIELKKTSQDRFTVQTDDVAQIQACENSHTTAFIALKYTHRELVVIRASHPVEDCPSAFNPRYGTTETFITDKPPLDDWSSSRSGSSDTDVLLDELDIGKQDTFDLTTEVKV